jgi:uroporphyrinogen decarboxylase
MNSRERVQAALNHQPTDRVPIFMWFHPETAGILSKLLEIPAGCLGDVMGNDVQQTWVNNNFAMEGIVHPHDGDSHVDAWGIQWVRGFGFNQIEHHPLGSSAPAEVLAYTFPQHQLPALFAAMDKVAPSAQEGEYFLGCDISPCVYEMYWRLRGMQQALLDMVENPDFAAAMLQRCADFAVLLGEEAFRRYPLDWLWTGDDVASQTNLIMSPHSWRKLVKPALARTFQLGKAHGVWVAYHCCGALRPIIPDLLEMGMDVLNPVQTNCPGMDIFELKREFGQHITFMGGLDTQYLLPQGTVSAVRQAVRKILDQVAYNGGYILAASHTIPPETPLENIFALYEEAGLPKQAIFDRAADLRKKLFAETGASSQ